MLTVDESGSPSVLFGRIKVVDQRISQVELFINRSRGDHGFSYSPEQLPGYFKTLMSPPAGRTKATRAELEQLAEAAFNPSSPMKVNPSPTCQFTEVGWGVVDPGLDEQVGSMPPATNPADPAASAPPAGGFDKNAPLGCMFPPSRPADPHARVLVIDEDLGFVVVGALTPGFVYPYPYLGHMLSAFIPNDMKDPMKAQDESIQIKVKKGQMGLLKPMPTTGDQLQVLQFYDGKLQAEQINLHLETQNATSDWVTY